MQKNKCKLDTMFNVIIVIAIILFFLLNIGCGGTIPRTVHSIQNTMILFTDADEAWKTCDASACTITYPTFKLIVVDKDLLDIERAIGHEMLHAIGIWDKNHRIIENR